MRAGLWVTAAAVTATVLTGCSSTGDGRARTVDDSGTVSTAGQAPPRTLTIEQAKSAVLVAADLPTGWIAEPDTGAPKKDSARDYDQCPAYDAVMPKVRRADDISAEFTAPDRSTVSESLLPLTEADAQRLLADFSAAVTACKKLTTQMDSGVTFDMYFTALSFPQLADETFAFRTTATVLGRTTNLDMAVARRGGVLVFIVQRAGEAIDTKLTEEVARRAVTKVDATLN